MILRCEIVFKIIYLIYKKNKKILIILKVSIEWNEKEDQVWSKFKI